MNKLPETLEEAVTKAAITIVPLIDKLGGENFETYNIYITAIAHGIWICMTDTDITEHASIIKLLESKIKQIQHDPSFSRLCDLKV